MIYRISLVLCLFSMGFLAHAAQQTKFDPALFCYPVAFNEYLTRRIATAESSRFVPFIANKIDWTELFNYYTQSDPHGTNKKTLLRFLFEMPRPAEATGDETIDARYNYDRTIEQLTPKIMESDPSAALEGISIVLKTLKNGIITRDEFERISFLVKVLNMNECISAISGHPHFIKGSEDYRTRPAVYDLRAIITHSFEILALSYRSQLKETNEITRIDFDILIDNLKGIVNYLTSRLTQHDKEWYKSITGREITDNIPAVAPSAGCLSSIQEHIMYPCVRRYHEYTDLFHGWFSLCKQWKTSEELRTAAEYHLWSGVALDKVDRFSRIYQCSLAEAFLREAATRGDYYKKQAVELVSAAHKISNNRWSEAMMEQIKNSKLCDVVLDLDYDAAAINILMECGAPAPMHQKWQQMQQKYTAQLQKEKTAAKSGEEKTNPSTGQKNNALRIHAAWYWIGGSIIVAATAAIIFYYYKKHTGESKEQDIVLEDASTYLVEPAQA